MHCMDICTAATWNGTLASHVTGGDTDHCTIAICQMPDAGPGLAQPWLLSSRCFAVHTVYWNELEELLVFVDGGKADMHMHGRCRQA